MTQEFSPPDGVLTVVIPVYNEEETLEEIVSRVRSVPFQLEIITVDDGSTDRSREILNDLKGRQLIDQVILHETNQGKGAALQSGFQAATGDWVVIQDADLEYDPAEYQELISPILEGKADVVYGSRFVGSGPHRVLYFWHYVANRMLTLLSNMMTNLNLTDMETCYKVFHRRVVDEIMPRLKQSRFGFEPEVTARIARRGFRVFEMSVKTVCAVEEGAELDAEGPRLEAEPEEVATAKTKPIPEQARACRPPRSPHLDTSTPSALSSRSTGADGFWWVEMR